MEVTEKIRKAILEATFDVFEKMFFIFLEPSEDASGEYDMETCIRFRGGYLSGSMRMLFTKSLAEGMTRNLLNLDAAPSEQQTTDCAKEAVNMVCGNFLSILEGKKVFDLSIPEFSGRPLKYVEKPGFYKVDLISDEGSLCLVIGISDP